VNGSAGWKSQATKDIQHVTPKDAGFAAKTRVIDIVYGQCAGNQFFVYILDVIYPPAPNAQIGEALAYAYVPGGTPKNCSPEGWSVPLNTPYGNDWYGVTVNYKAGTDFDSPTLMAPAQ
jgi:hypothetical protein